MDVKVGYCVDLSLSHTDHSSQNVSGWKGISKSDLLLGHSRLGRWVSEREDVSFLWFPCPVWCVIA